MKNYVQPGKTLTLTAPYDVVSGGGALIGSILGIAAAAVLSGASGEFDVQGVFDLKAEGAVSAQDGAAGAPVFWDNSAKQITMTASGNRAVGFLTEAKLTADVVARVLLNQRISETGQGVTALTGTLTGTANGVMVDVAATAAACAGGATPSATQVDTAIALAVSTIVSGTNEQLKELMTKVNAIINS